MALLLITNPPTTLGDSSEWTELVLRSTGNMLGHGLSIPIFTLTNWDATTTKPQIAEGSIIEVGGSFYQADADTALTDEGGLSDGTCRIKLVPAGGGGSVVPTLTNDSIPAWDANKAGWYDSDDKFLPHEMEKASAVYTVKSEYIAQSKTIKIGSDGILYTDEINEITTDAGVDIDGVVLKDSGVTATVVAATNKILTDEIEELTPGAGVNLVGGLTLVDLASTGKVFSDEIIELTPAAGIGLSSNLLPTPLPGDASWALTTTPTIIPRGIYSIEHITHSLSYSRIEMFVNGGWAVISTGSHAQTFSATTNGDVIFSDGVNFRASMGTGSGTVYYRKF